jgi:hypothetical protein
MRPHRPSIDGKHVKQETAKERKARKRAEAEERNAAWCALTANEKMRILQSARPGASQRQCERIRLAARPRGKS